MVHPIPHTSYHTRFDLSAPHFHPKSVAVHRRILWNPYGHAAPKPFRRPASNTGIENVVLRDLLSSGTAGCLLDDSAKTFLDEQASPLSQAIFTFLAVGHRTLVVQFEEAQLWVHFSDSFLLVLVHPFVHLANFLEKAEALAGNSNTFWRAHSILSEGMLIFLMA